MINKIILASSSPRRKEILGRLGLDFEIISPDADEKCDEGMAPWEYVCELSKRKCDAVLKRLSPDEAGADTLVIACDTVVVYGGHIIGKPESLLHALVTLRLLSDSYHDVYSGLTLSCGGKTVSRSARTKVKMRAVSEAETEKYVASGEPMGKAGSYAIQGIGSALVEKIDGDFYNVMGFPVPLFCEMLESEYGISVFSLMK